MVPAPQSGWFFNLLVGLLRGDAQTLGLLRTNPFPTAPPRFLRAQYFQYKFTTREQRTATGLWWDRKLIGTFYGPVSLGRQ